MALPPHITPVAPSVALASLASLASARFISFPEAVEAYLSTAAQIVGVRSAFVSQLDGHLLELLASWSEGGCALPQHGTLSLEEVPCQYVRAEASPVVISDTAHDPRVQNLPIIRTLGMGSYLGVPLMSEAGEVIGSFCMVDPEPRPFTEDAVSALVVLAHQLVRLVERELAQRAMVKMERDTAEDMAAMFTALDERSVLLQAVAHDLRTPLTAIRGYADLLAKGIFGAATPNQQMAMGQVNRAARYMNRLINDLLDLCQSERGSIVLVSEPYQPAELAGQIRDVSAALAEERGLELCVEAEADLPEVIGDSARVQQLLVNLVSNALTYSSAGAVTLQVARDNEHIVYSVTDSGPGIAAEALPHIWRLGWRASDGARGTGLGLYLVKRLAEAMGGSVCVASTTGAGCTFTVRLPLAVERPVRASLLG